MTLAIVVGAIVVLLVISYLVWPSDGPVVTPPDLPPCGDDPRPLHEREQEPYTPFAKEIGLPYSPEPELEPELDHPKRSHHKKPEPEPPKRDHHKPKHLGGAG